MKNANHEVRSVYLFPREEHRYGATASAGIPPMEGAVKLTDIQGYPVNVFYTRTDLNGSLCYEEDICADQSELLASLEWCGQCRYTIHQIWDFDLAETKEDALVQLFNDASNYRLAIIAKELDQIAWAEEEPAPQPLSEKINAAQQNAASAMPQNPHTPQEPTH